jgi:NitT/TauT family transport system substrate-binding protein
VQPFLVDPKLSQQGFATSEPFSIEKGGVKPVVFLLAEQGYPPYSEVLAVRRDALRERTDALTRFVRASAKGGRATSPIRRPATLSSSATIRRCRTSFSRTAIARCWNTGSSPVADTATLGLLTMTDKRWQQTLEFLRGAGLAKAGVDYAPGYTLSIVGT